MNEILQGRDEEQGLPVRTRNSTKEGKKGSDSIQHNRQQPPGGEAERKRLGGGSKGQQRGQFSRYRQFRNSFYRLRRGSLAACRTSAPSWGRKANTGGFLSCPDFPL